MKAATVTHTPGPWTSRCDDRLEIDAIETVMDGRRYMVAMAHSYTSRSIDRETRAANARLMAAAPDLLAAVNEAENWVDNHGDAEHEAGAAELLAMLRAALAKAEPQQPDAARNGGR